jgi:hypothetical protein
VAHVRDLYSYYARRDRHRESSSRSAVVVSGLTGQGVGVHETFNLNGRAAILSIGILDSISAGILLYSKLNHVPRGRS